MPLRKKKAERDLSPTDAEPSPLDKLANMMVLQMEQARQDREAMQAMLQQALQVHSAVPVVPDDVSSIPDGTRSNPGVPIRPVARQPNAVPPAKLSPSISLREFKMWRAAWSDYAELLQISSMSPRTQLAYFRSCLTAEMRSTLSHAIGIKEDDDATPVDVILHRIGEFFHRQRNVALRRVKFEERKQQDGESFDDFYVRLRELADDAQLCDTCLDDRLVTRITSGIRNDQTRTKLLAQDPPPSLAAALGICRSEESAHNTQEDLTRQGNIFKVTKHKLQNRSRSQPQHFKQQLKRFCEGCGSSVHTDGREKHCPAWGKQCKACGVANHFAKVCKKKALKPTKAANSVGIHRIILNDLKSSERSKQAPKVRVTICKNSVELGTLQATPDSGAESTAIGPRQLHALGLAMCDLLPVDDADVRAANGTKLTPIGCFQATVILHEASVSTTVDVLKELDEVLLSWYDAKALRILPHHYPKQIKSLNHREASEDDATLQRQINNDLKCLLEEFNDVLVAPSKLHSGSQLKVMTGPAMKIHMCDNPRPYQQRTARNIPLAWREETKQLLESMVQQGIIAPVGDEPSDWCHPMVVAPKPKGGIRITVDLTKLNKHVIRPIHPAPTPRDSVLQVTSGSRFFTTMDAMWGYWQIPLDEEAQLLTTFITPWGRYKFLRGPMGFIATGDEFCRRSDIALDGIIGCVKVIDDLLCWDTSYKDHFERVRSILLRCRQHGITLNKDKFIYAQSSVEFCGYRVGKTGVAADPGKVQAIAEFPPPTNVTDLRSFMGLVNQLADFTPDIATAANDLRDLLKSKNMFIWTADHQKSFDLVKKTLSSPPVLGFFDPSLETMLQTDASRLKGLGYALLQKHGSAWKLIQCGSRFLTDTESRYAMIELELLAAVWAMRKCRNLLLGVPNFQLITDHKPLVPILNDYTLDAVENLRLQRLKEKTSMFSFTAVWRKGKEHAIPDALSRAPVADPVPEDFEAETDVTHHLRRCILAQVSDVSYSNRSHLEDPVLEDIRKTAKDDEAYCQLYTVAACGFPSDKRKVPAILQDFWKVREHLSVDDGIVLHGSRLVIPSAMRKDVLGRLHDSHCRIEATKRRARQTVWWPGISSDIKNTVQACDACQTLLPSQAKEPLKSEPPPSRPFEDVSADIFTYAGKNFLVYTDRLSGWPQIGIYGSDSSSRTTIRLLRSFFTGVGVPIRLRTDGGPQFSSHNFKAFLKRWGVSHVKSSPHYPQSNGHAEAAVKQMKYLVMKTTTNGKLDSEEFDRGLLEMRNTPNQSGVSPAEVIFGRPMRTVLPAHHLSFAPKLQAAANDYDVHQLNLRQRAAKYYNRSARPLPPLKIGAEVRLQDPVSKRWDKVGTIVGVGRQRDYHIKTPSGRTLWRNRRFLRAQYQPVCPKAELKETSNVSTHKESLRRGQRQRRRPDCLKL